MNDLRLTAASITLCLSIFLVADLAGAVTDIPRGEGPNPWTHLNFLSDPSHFQFAVVSDRHGGNRPGVFERAVDKLNLLQPEFVMCVGDLVAGGAQDEAEMNAQRDEFDSIVKRLEPPFFYLPGNHDVTNSKSGTDVWLKRLGRLYYHFVYNDVLFICLNTDDGGVMRIGEEQTNYVRKVIASNPKPRWTFIFMHKPLWSMEDSQGWENIEKELGDRPFTVFAGHTHEYLLHNRNGHDYHVLSTTGAGTAGESAITGQFDQLVWITMTAQGPRVANLMLDGIADKNILTVRKKELADPIIAERVVSNAPVRTSTTSFTQANVELRLANPADISLKASGIINPNGQIQPSLTHVERTIPPRAEERIPLSLKAANTLDVRDMLPIVTKWTLTYEIPETGILEIPMEHRIVVDAPFSIARASRPIAVDGSLAEWDAMPYAGIEPGQVAYGVRTWDGAADCSFRFNLAYDDTACYLGLRITDDRVMPKIKGERGSAEKVELFIDARPEPERKPPQEGAKKDTGYLLIGLAPSDAPAGVSSTGKDPLPTGILCAGKRCEDGYIIEVAVPASLLDAAQRTKWESLRFNLAVSDVDSPSDRPAKIWWRPNWASGADYAGSGTFTRGR